mgnify:FL=1
MEKENKGRAIALLPIGVFLIIFSRRGNRVRRFLCNAGNRCFFDRIVCCFFAEQRIEF